MSVHGLDALLPMQVIYNPQELHYEQLLDTFFQHVDPTTKDRQGGDRGTQYRSAIYYHTPEQKAAAQKVRSTFTSACNSQSVKAEGHYIKGHLITSCRPGKRSTQGEISLVMGAGSTMRMRWVCLQSLSNGAGCSAALSEASTLLLPLRLLCKLGACPLTGERPLL